VELVRCQQVLELQRFTKHCVGVDAKCNGRHCRGDDKFRCKHDNAARDAKIRQENKFHLTPFWYARLPAAEIGNGHFVVHDHTSAFGIRSVVSSSSPQHPPPLTPRWEKHEDHMDEDAWNPSAPMPGELRKSPVAADNYCVYHLLQELRLLIYGAGVNEDWLSGPLRALPLFIVMAHGSRAYNKDTAGVNGKLLSTPADGDKLVNIQLLRTQLPQRLTVHIQHVLPQHPSIISSSSTNRKSVTFVAFINGPMQGQVRKVDRVEQERVWVKEVGKGSKKPATEHSMYDLVLTGQPPKQKRG